MVRGTGPDVHRRIPPWLWCPVRRTRLLVMLALAAQIDRGVRIVSGGSERTARIGRAHTGRTLPVG